MNIKKQRQNLVPLIFFYTKFKKNGLIISQMNFFNKISNYQKLDCKYLHANDFPST